MLIYDEMPSHDEGCTCECELDQPAHEIEDAEILAFLRECQRAGNMTEADVHMISKNPSENLLPWLMDFACVAR